MTAPEEHSARLLNLAIALEEDATGKDVWRVANPEGAYCVEHSYDDSCNPKRDCCDWIAAHAAYAAARQYSTQKVRVFTHNEQLMRDTASELRLLAGAPGELVPRDDDGAAPAHTLSTEIK